MSLTRQSKRLIARGLVAALSVSVPGWLYGYWFVTVLEGLNGLAASAIAAGIVLVNVVILVVTSFELASQRNVYDRRRVLTEYKAWRLIRIGLFVIAPVITVWIILAWHVPIIPGTISGVAVPAAIGSLLISVWAVVSVLVAKWEVKRRLEHQLESQVKLWTWTSNTPKA